MLTQMTMNKECTELLQYQTLLQLGGIYEVLSLQVTFTNRCRANHRQLCGSVCDEEYPDDDNMTMSILAKPLSLNWIPCDDVSASSTYARTLRQDMQQSSSSHCLWLCNHCYLPVSVSPMITE